MRRNIVFLLVAAGFLFGYREFTGHRARAGDKKSPTPITKVGEHKVFDGRVLVKVVEKDGHLDYSIKITHDEKEGIFGIWPAEEKLKKGNAVWVIYPETDHKVWVFWCPQKDGHQLRLCELKQEKGKWKIVTNTPWDVTIPDSIGAMPKVMVDALPKEFVAKYKPQK